MLLECSYVPFSSLLHYEGTRNLNQLIYFPREVDLITRIQHNDLYSIRSSQRGGRGGWLIESDSLCFT